jgi:hypothetical protein
MRFSVHAMERTGHNAIRDWIAANGGGETKDCIGSLSSKRDPRYPRHILVIRDPMNWLASRLKHIGDQTGTPKKYWKSIEAEIELIKTHYDAAKCYAFPWISFNDWFSSGEYRKRKAAEFGLRSSEEGLNSVTGKGSSFDSRRFDGRAQKMAVLNRWRQYRGDQRYRSLLDDELRDISLDLFGIDVDELLG